MKFKITPTIIFVCLTVGLWIVYDIIAVLIWGIPGTISYAVLDGSHHYPIIPFGVGLVCGHLFWPNVDGEKVIR